MSDEIKRPTPPEATPVCFTEAHRRGIVTLPGAAALLELEADLGRYYSQAALDRHFLKLARELAEFFNEAPEAAGLFTRADLQEHARQFAAKLLAAGRTRQTEFGM
jgi:hypothetical protein